MRRIALAVMLAMLAPGALAQASLQGHWDVRSPGYVGVVLIDAEGRATWDSPSDYGRPAKFFGYIAKREGQKVEIHFTNRERVTRTHCVLQFDDTMSCYNVRHDATTSEPYMLMRVGPGPQSLMPASR